MKWLKIILKFWYSTLQMIITLLQIIFWGLRPCYDMSLYNIYQYKIFIIIKKKFTLVVKIMKILKFRWKKKTDQVILHYLGTLHHQVFKLVVNNNVKQISKTFNIVSNFILKQKWHFEKIYIYYQNGKGIQIIIFKKNPKI